jgi:hypothetical protein
VTGIGAILSAANWPDTKDGLWSARVCQRFRQVVRV